MQITSISLSPDGPEDERIRQFFQAIAVTRPRKLDFCVPAVTLADFLDLGENGEGNLRRILRTHYVEGEDYIVSEKDSGGGRPIKVYSMNVDTFKMLCMQSHSKRGHAVRKYYIDVEEAFYNENRELRFNLDTIIALAYAVMTGRTALPHFITYLEDQRRPRLRNADESKLLQLGQSKDFVEKHIK